MSVVRCTPAEAGVDVDDLIAVAESCAAHDPRRCGELIVRAESELSGQRDVVRSARISRLRGDLAVAEGDLGAAASSYREARRHWLVAGRWLDAARAAAGTAEVQLLAGEFDAAEAGLARLQDELGRGQHEDPMAARLGALVRRQLADVRAGEGDLSAALRQYDAAENLFGALADAESIARVQFRRGLAALDAGLPHSALLELNRARVAYEKVGQDSQAVLATMLVAEAFCATGQVSRSLQILDCIEPGPPGTRWESAVHALVRSGALLRAGFAAEAHSEARTAEDLFARIGAMEQSARATLQCARASLALGRLRASATELEIAERLFGVCGSRLMLMHTWLLQAETSWALGDTRACRSICERIIAAEVDDTPPFVRVRARVGAAQASAPEAAQSLLEDAAAIAGGAAVPELRVDVLLARARHERRTGQVERAVDTLHHLLRVGKGWERQVGQRGSIACPALTEANEELIMLLLERGDHAGRVEALRRARAAKRTGLTLTSRSPGAGRDDGDRPRLDRLLSDAIAPVTVAAEVVDDILPPVPSGSSVEYYVAADDVVAFVVREGQVDARVLERAAESSRRLARAWQQECALMAPGLADHVGFTSSATLDGLFDLLLAPVVDLLADLDDELQVRGHRHLHGLPFDALLDEVGPWYAHLDRPVAEVESSPAVGGPAPTALVLAVPDENAPSIAREAEMVCRTLPGADVLVGTEVTKDALARRSAGVDVVHFACHGVFRPDDPLSSGLRLADGWLRAREIAAGAVALDGAVVVLSACSSGCASDYTPEPVGLAAACLAAGARGVVAALWAVDDEVTLELMTYFYRALAEGIEPPAALRRARRLVARTHPHPYYWGAFRFVGRTDLSE